MKKDPIQALIKSAIEEGDFPSAVWAVAKGSEMVSKGAEGFAQLVPEKIPAGFETIYDLASLTKPLVTGLLTEILVDREEIGFSDEVRKFFPPFDTAEKVAITIKDLLAHRSGFEAWRPFYLETGGSTRGERLDAIVSRLAEIPLEYPTGTKVIYSDLNFILLGAILENVFGGDLAQAAEKHIFRPLNLSNAFFDPPSARRRQIAASEEGNLFERQTAAARGYDVEGYAWRTGIILGEVHDGNCHYLGGISGHAGLFADAADTLTLARQFLPAFTEVLEPTSCGVFARDLTVGLDQARSVAFQMAATASSSAHGALPDSAFGHLGFTGTSLWIEPDTEGIYLLLTNRTHTVSPPFADLFRIRKKFLELAGGLSE